MAFVLSTINVATPTTTQSLDTFLGKSKKSNDEKLVFDVLVIDQILSLPRLDQILNSTRLNFVATSDGFGSTTVDIGIPRNNYFASKYFNDMRPSKTSFYTDDFNDNALSRAGVIDSLHKKFLNDMICDDYPILLQYLKVKNGKIEVVKNKEERDANKISDDSKSLNSQKIMFIENNILNARVAEKILEKFVDKKKVDWVELTLYDSILGEVLARYVKSQLTSMMSNT